MNLNIIKNSPCIVGLIFIALVISIIQYKAFKRLRVEVSDVMAQVSDVMAQVNDVMAQVNHTGKLREVINVEGSVYLRTLVDCPKSTANKKVGSFIVFGQSNAGNSAEPFFVPYPYAVFNFFNGKCYVAVDPLLGADGYLSNPWGRLANKLINRRVYDSVVIVPIARGGTYLEDWAPNGKWNSMLMNTINDVKAAGLEITALLWHHGEGGVGLHHHPTEYTTLFTDMITNIRGTGVTAPVYAVTATICGSGMGPFDAFMLESIQSSLAHQLPRQLIELISSRQIIRNQQRELSKLGMNINPGPDTDKINPALREDACHISGHGLDMHAELWFTTLTGQNWQGIEFDSMLYSIVYTDGRVMPEYVAALAPINSLKCGDTIKQSIDAARDAGFEVLGIDSFKDHSTNIIIRQVCFLNDFSLMYNLSKIMMSTVANP